MELCVAKLKLRPAHEQPEPTALTHWQTFVREHPEVRDRHVYFVTLRDRYADEEELTASCTRRAAPRVATARRVHAFSRGRLHARAPDTRDACTPLSLRHVQTAVVGASRRRGLSSHVLGARFRGAAAVRVRPSRVVRRKRRAQSLTVPRAVAAEGAGLVEP